MLISKMVAKVGDAIYNFRGSCPAGKFTKIADLAKVVRLDN